MKKAKRKNTSRVPVPHAAALLLPHGASGMLRASTHNGSTTSPQVWQRLSANRGAVGSPFAPQSAQVLNPGRICGGACCVSPPAAPSPAPAAQACGQVLLLGSLNSASPPDFPAFNGAALQAGTGPEGFLFLSSRFSPPPLICSALPGGPPSAVGSDPYYGRGEKGRTRTPPECRERFLELPDKKHPPLCLWMCVRGCQLPTLPVGDTGAGTR